MWAETRQIWLGVAGGVVLLVAATASAIAIHHFANSDILVALLGLAGAIIVASMQYRWAKVKEAEARLFSEKQEVYTELISTIMGMFHNPAFREPSGDLDQAQLVRKLQKIRTKLIVWGSAQTIITLDQMATLADEEGALDKGLQWLSAIFTAIRADLGHKDPPRAGLDIALGMLIPSDRVQAKMRLGGRTPS